MSIESAKAFIDRMKTDEDFAKLINGIQDMDERMVFVKGEGYAINLNELTDIQCMLGDAELEQVVGGIVVATCCSYRRK